MGRARIRAILAGLRPALARLLLILLLPLSLLIAGAAVPPAAAARAVAGQLDALAPAAEGAAAAGRRAITAVAVVAEATTPGWSPPALRWRRPLQPARGWRTGPGLFAAADLPAASAASASDSAQAPAAGEGPSGQPASPLQRRLQQWPAWTLPAPLPRPGRQAPLWPAWFSGEWLVESTPLREEGAAAPQPGTAWSARFRPDGRGGAVAERAFNALSVGRSQLGEQLLSVQDDPRNPQRQLARLAGERLLETTLIGQRGEAAGPRDFLNDELSLLVLHGPGEPRLSRIETLGRWRLQDDGSITGDQWQARYASPSDGLAATALASEHWRLRLVPVPTGSDRATETAAPAAGYR